MLDHSDILKTLVNGTRGVRPVTIRETNFGYVVRSEKPGVNIALRDRIIRFALVAVWIAVAGIWLVPLSGPAFAIKAFFSVGLLALSCLAVVLLRRDTGGYELHVDTSRRELRSAVLSAKGECWVRARARFAEVGDPVMRRGKTDADIRSLSLRIIGEAEAMPVAVGDEATLLAVHDRLMRDLRPIEERLAGYAHNSVARRPSGRVVFPQLGPEELTT